MRRVALLALTLAAVVALAKSDLPGDGRRELEARVIGIENPDYRVDAIFDSARGLLPGQVVKIAGARVGVVDDVGLTPDFKARVEMRVERRWAPFSSRATCAIQPEGLIGERFVQCEPGSGSPLSASDDAPPTVPVERTRLPVSITDLFQIFDAPSRQRISLVLATLGLTTAGRGEDLNAIIRRANQALASVHRVLGIVGEHRRQLRNTVAATDAVLAELAGRREDVRRFIDHAAAVTTQTAARRDELAATVERLPALLEQADPALGELHGLAIEGEPVLRELRAAAPDLTQLLARVQPFADAATPIASELRAELPDARAVVRTATPIVEQLRSFAHVALPVGRRLQRTLTDARNRGFVDNLLRLTYRLAVSTNRFDSVSHLFPVQLYITEGCLGTSDVPNPRCDTHFNRTEPATPAPVRRPPPPEPSRRAPRAPAPAPGPAPTATQAPAEPAPSARPLLPPIVQDLLDPLRDLTDFLLAP